MQFHSKFSTLEASNERDSGSQKPVMQGIGAWEGSAKINYGSPWCETLASVTPGLGMGRCLCHSGWMIFLQRWCPALQLALPGYIRVLSEEQQNLLGVDEECPAGEAAEEQDEGPPLQDNPDMLQVLAPVCLESKQPH